MKVENNKTKKVAAQLWRLSSKNFKKRAPSNQVATSFPRVSEFSERLSEFSERLSEFSEV